MCRLVKVETVTSDHESRMAKQSAKARFVSCQVPLRQTVMQTNHSFETAHHPGMKEEVVCMQAWRHAQPCPFPTLWLPSPIPPVVASALRPPCLTSPYPPVRDPPNPPPSPSHSPRL